MTSSEQNNRKRLRGQYPSEKHAGRAKSDAAEFQTADRHPEYADKGDNTNRVRNRLRSMQIKKPLNRVRSQ